MEQELLGLLVADPPRPYAEISRRLGIPVGSIGPARARLLEKLRRDTYLTLSPSDPPDPDAISVADRTTRG